MDLKNEYKKALKALKERIRYYQKQGIITNINTPKTPKNITEKSVARLKSISGEKIKSKAIYVNLDTGETVSKKQWKKEQALKPKTRNRVKRSTQKPKIDNDFVDFVVVTKQTFNDTVAGYPKRAKEIVNDWLMRVGDSRETWIAVKRAMELGIFIEANDGFDSSHDYQSLRDKLSSILEFLDLTEEQAEDLENSFVDTSDMYDSEGEELY